MYFYVMSMLLSIGNPTKRFGEFYFALEACDEIRDRIVSFAR